MKEKEDNFELDCSLEEDFDFDSEFDSEDLIKDEFDIPEIKEPKKQKVPSRALKNSARHQKRRAFSEENLLKILPEHPEEGCSYHVLTGGNIDSLSFIKYILNTQDLEYCLLSTWCMAMCDVEEFRKWVNSGRIKRLDAYVGEIFQGSYAVVFDALKEVVEQTGGRICIFRNHAKIFAGIGKNFSFAIESSANINTNPRTENSTITLSKEVFLFYKEYFDGINSFNKGFEDWKPWELN